MKKIVFASLAALAFAAPAYAADFTGARIGANVGFADDDAFGTEAFTYGVNVGYDVAFGKVVVGATAEIQESPEDFVGRDLSVTARIGGLVGERALVYGLAGYTNLGTEELAGKLDGYRVGLGAEVALADHVYSTVEYRYSNYEAGVDAHQMLLGIGYRF